MKQYLKQYNALVVFGVVLFAMLLMISMKLPLSADDFAYSVNRINSAPLTGVNSVIQSVFYEYQTWMGRILCFFFAQLSYLTPNQMLFRLTFPVVNLLIVYEIFVLCTNRFKLSNNDVPLLCIIACLFYTFHRKVLNQTLFWMIGYYTYIFPLLFLLIPLIYLANLLLNRNNSNLENYSYGIGILSFAGCLFVEHISLFIFVFACVAFIYCKYRKVATKKTLYFILAGTFLGLVILMSAPGIMNRLDTGNTIVQMGLREQLYFGYTRFIYTFYSLNQPIFLVYSIVLICAKWIKNGKNKVLLTLLLIPVMVSSLILIFDLDIFYSEDIKYFLTFEWSYYHWDRLSLMRTSLIVIYTICVLFLGTVDISFTEKSPYAFVIYCASVLLQAIFMVTGKACERTSHISAFLLILLIFYVIVIINKEKMIKVIGIFSAFVLFSYLCFIHQIITINIRCI